MLTRRRQREISGPSMVLRTRCSKTGPAFRRRRPMARSSGKPPLERQYLHLKVRDLPTSRARAGSSVCPFARVAREETGSGLPLASPAAQAAGPARHGSQRAECCTKERIRKEPLSGKRCLHPRSLPVDANLVAVHCSLTFCGYSGWTSRSTVSEWRMNCNERRGEFSVVLPTQPARRVASKCSNGVSPVELANAHSPGLATRPVPRARCRRPTCDASHPAAEFHEPLAIRGSGSVNVTRGNSQTHQPLRNYWGYDPAGCFAPKASWTCLARHEEIHRFARGTIAFRNAHPVLSREQFYSAILPGRRTEAK
jgi:hypothetical protein